MIPLPDKKYSIRSTPSELLNNPKFSGNDLSLMTHSITSESVSLS